MKRCIVFIIALFSFSALLAAKKLTLMQNNGEWRVADSWDLKRVPASGDTIVIPAGKTVLYLTMDHYTALVVQVYGTFKITSGKLTIDDASSIMVYSGGVVSGTEVRSNIAVGKSDKLKGRETIYGVSYANATTGSSPHGFAPVATAESSRLAGSGSTLPVQFISYTVSAFGKGALLQWATAEEVNAYRYEVQRSTDAKAWTTIALVGAAGNATGVNRYNYSDKSKPTGLVYYRIRQVDRDSRYAFTPVKTLQGGEKSPTTFRLLTTHSSLIIEVGETMGGGEGLTVEVVALSGQVVGRQSYPASARQLSFSKPPHLKGLYLLTLTGQKTKTRSQQILL